MGLFHIALEISDDSMKQFFKTGPKISANGPSVDFWHCINLVG